MKQVKKWKLTKSKRCFNVCERFTNQQACLQWLLIIYLENSILKNLQILWARYLKILFNPQVTVPTKNKNRKYYLFQLLISILFLSTLISKSISTIIVED